MSSKKLLFTLLMIGLVSTPVSGDEIEGKDISCNYKIENKEEYSNHTFIIGKPIGNSKCKWYKLNSYSFNQKGMHDSYVLLAVKKSDFQEIKEKARTDNVDGKVLSLNDPRLIQSNTILRSKAIIPSGSPVRNCTICLRVNEITNNEFKIQKTKIIYRNQFDSWKEEYDGKILELPFWYRILPLISVIIIGILLRKDKEKLNKLKELLKN